MLQRDVRQQLAADGIRGEWKGARKEGKEGDGTGGEVGELDWSDDDEEDALPSLAASPPQISTPARPRCPPSRRPGARGRRGR